MRCALRSRRNLSMLTVRRRRPGRRSASADSTGFWFVEFQIAGSGMITSSARVATYG
jgi:hypothetical protein